MDSMKQSQQAKREMLAQWRAGLTRELTLPSGLTVMVADVTITDLMFTKGALPPSVLAMAEQAEKAGKTEMDLQTVAQNAGEFGQLLDAMVLAAVKDPPIAAHGDDDHLGLDELPGNDKMFIFNYLNRETEAVRSFRDEGKPVAAGPAGAQVLDEAK